MGLERELQKLVDKHDYERPSDDSISQARARLVHMAGPEGNSDYYVMLAEKANAFKDSKIPELKNAARFFIKAMTETREDGSPAIFLMVNSRHGSDSVTFGGKHPVVSFSESTVIGNSAADIGRFVHEVAHMEQQLEKSLLGDNVEREFEAFVKEFATYEQIVSRYPAQKCPAFEAILNFTRTNSVPIEKVMRSLSKMHVSYPKYDLDDLVKVMKTDLVASQ